MKTCYHCGHTGPDVREYGNTWDWDVLRDPEPPIIVLCEDTAACVRRRTAPAAVLGAVR